MDSVRLGTDARQVPGRRRHIWGTEKKGQRQESACFPPGGGHCPLPGPPFLHKAHPQQSPPPSVPPSVPGFSHHFYLCSPWCGAGLTPGGALSRKRKHCSNARHTSSPFKAGRFLLQLPQKSVSFLPSLRAASPTCHSLPTAQMNPPEYKLPPCWPSLGTLCCSLGNVWALEGPC